jgi:hypothetical protein
VQIEACIEEEEDSTDFNIHNYNRRFNIPEEGQIQSYKATALGAHMNNYS